MWFYFNLLYFNVILLKFLFYFEFRPYVIFILNFDFSILNLDPVLF